jgi:hypothetical protein
MRAATVAAMGDAMLLRALATLSITLLSAGCAIHPVPENVTGVDTEDIVRQIR